MTCAYTSEQALDAVVGWSNRYGYSEEFKQFAIAVMIGESGMNPCAVGDNGQSHGIYQFYTNGGRGTGIPIETLQNPYWQAEHNLQILHDAFEKYGGDAGWGNDPYNTLKFGWKYGQGSIWPSDGQLRDALGRLGKIDIANFDSSWPEPSTPSEPSEPQPDRPTPVDPSTDLSQWRFLAPTLGRLSPFTASLERISPFGQWLNRQPGFTSGLERRDVFAPPEPNPLLTEPLRLPSLW